MPPADATVDSLSPHWSVHRQDDNGNRFVVESGLSREEAEQIIAMYEARGHKQMYWAVPERRSKT